MLYILLDRFRSAATRHGSAFWCPARSCHYTNMLPIRLVGVSVALHVHRPLSFPSLANFRSSAHLQIIRNLHSENSHCAIHAHVDGSGTNPAPFLFREHTSRPSPSPQCVRMHTVHSHVVDAYTCIDTHRCQRTCSIHAYTDPQVQIRAHVAKQMLVDGFVDVFAATTMAYGG
jgi:hypothetical protein